MYSLQHPQVDESFLQSKSKVEEVILLLRSMIPPNEEETEPPTEEEKTSADVTNDNFMVTQRSNRTETKENPVNKSGNRFPFMRQVEVEQSERSKARLERERIAQNFRKLGNSEYRQGNYENAMKMYTQAIDYIKDSPILYINRSLCYMKMGKFKRGIIDCDFVLNKLDEKNLRAWLYRAMAYKGLNDEPNYLNCIKYVRKYHSKQVEFIDSFVEKIEKHSNKE